MKYPFSVYQTKVESHVFWIAESSVLKGCVGQGDVPEDAIRELESNEEAWIETARRYGISVPDVPLEPINSYSGKFTVRVSTFVHKTAAELAKKQGVSLNQYVNDAIVSYNSSVSTVSAISPVVANAIRDIKYLASITTVSFDGSHSIYEPAAKTNLNLKQRYKT